MLPCFPEYVQDIAVHFGRGGVGALELALELQTGLHCLGDVGCGSERARGGDVCLLIVTAPHPARPPQRKLSRRERGRCGCGCVIGVGGVAGGVAVAAELQRMASM